MLQVPQTIYAHPAFPDTELARETASEIDRKRIIHFGTCYPDYIFVDDEEQDQPQEAVSATTSAPTTES